MESRWQTTKILCFIQLISFYKAHAFQVGFPAESKPNKDSVHVLSALSSPPAQGATQELCYQGLLMGLLPHKASPVDGQGSS